MRCPQHERPAKWLSRCGFLVLILSGFSLGAARPAEGQGFAVIVNMEVEGSEISRSALADIFLRKARRWEDGQPILPVDQSMSSKARRQFTADVLGQSSLAMLHYWQEQIKRGIRPPKVFDSELDLLEYIASTPGAIGYVSAGTAVDEGSVKILRIKTSEGPS